MSLTKYKEGSLKELLAISLPLMLSSFSVMLMLFVDRLLLAHYSSEALNAAVNASTVGWSLIFGWVILGSISQVFVSQYYGSKNYLRIGQPVWQMLWLSFFSVLFFLPLGIWGSHLIYPGSDEQMQNLYLKWMLLFGPTNTAYAALSGFFIGRGKTALITWLAVFANILNAVLDVILIFGIEGFVPSMGIEGAAISTSIGSLFQAVVLFVVFLKKENRIEFNTGDFRWDFKSFYQCLKIGTPESAFGVIEVLAWAYFYAMMSGISEKHITIAGICQSFFLLFVCVAEAISKAVIAITGNFIGSRRTWFIANTLKSGFIVHVIFFIGMIVAFLLFHHTVIDQFLPNATPEFIASIEPSLNICLLMTIIYIFLEGLRWLLTGVLTAAADTRFLMVAGSLCVWFLMVLPVYILVVKWHGSIELATFFWIIFSGGSCFIYYLRYKSDLWKNKTII